MENNQETRPVWNSRKPKGIKTADVKRLRKEGLSLQEIADKMDISYATVAYHLAKKRKDAGTVRVKSQMSAETPTPIPFEADLFGTILKLDRTPLSIERIGNRIVIK